MLLEPFVAPTGAKYKGCGWCGKGLEQLALEHAQLQMHPRGDSVICTGCLVWERKRPMGVCALVWGCKAPPRIDARLCDGHHAAQVLSGLDLMTWLDRAHDAWERDRVKRQRAEAAARYAEGFRTEKQVVAETLRALEQETGSVLKVTRIHSGMHEVDGRKMKAGEDGIADFLLELRVPGWPLPVPMWLELKGTDGRQADAQKRWEGFCIRDGRLYRLAHSAAEALAAVRGVVGLGIVALDALRPRAA